MLELYGPASRTHYAIMPKGDVDPRFMYARFQIAVVEYDPGEKKDQHNAVPEWLEMLAKAIEDAESAPVAWSWGRAETREQRVKSSRADLEVVRGPLPSAKEPGECLVVRRRWPPRRRQLPHLPDD